MGTHNICLYKEVDKNYTGCNQKTTELLDCALMGAWAVIGSNTVGADLCGILFQFVICEKTLTDCGNSSIVEGLPFASG